MFIGHYGAALAVAGGARGPSLAAACVAVQLVDFAWAGFILTGIEKASVEPGFLALSPLNLSFMPYTHSLPAALAWSLGGAMLYRALFAKGGFSAAALIGVAIFSHWITDVLVHAPDMGLWMDQYKIGLALWDQPTLGVGLELGLLGLGLVIYMLRTRGRSLWGRIAPFGFLGLLCILGVVNWLGPAPASIDHVALSALGVFTLIAVLALWPDRLREPKPKAAT
jgi:hypothetical protein